MAKAMSIKQNLINKANTTIVASTAAACFIVIFTIVASIQLVGQLSYQQKVIGKKKEALKTLKADIKAVDELTASYKAFTNTSTNVLGGDPNGIGPMDGNNAKIVLDALPSKYDYPALTTSLENILLSQAQKIQSITGTDDAINQENSQSSSSPQPIEMPFEVTVQGSYDGMRSTIIAMERSIRPIKVQSLTINTSQSAVTMIVAGKTYFQPEKNLNIRTEVLK